MKILIIDTSTKFLYVSLTIDNLEVYKHILEGKNNHSEHLIPIITKALQENNIGVGDLDKIIVGKGPGSYTGLRISMTVAKMFAWSKKIDLYAISSLDIIASGYFKKNGIYAIKSFAKYNYIYDKIVEVKEGNINILTNDEFSLESDFDERIKGFDCFIINENNYIYDVFKIIDLATDKCVDIHSLGPNYLRKVL